MKYFKTIKKCPLCYSTRKIKAITNNQNIYSYFISRILNLKEEFILKYMKNYQCNKCGLIYKKTWLKSKYINEIYSHYQATHPGGLNTLKKNFGKKKFIKLIKDYFNFDRLGEKELCKKSQREIIKILNFTDNDQNKFKKLKAKFIHKLKNNDTNFIKFNYLNLSNFITKPKIYSQFSGFRSKEISLYLDKNLDLENIRSYAEIGCPLWGNYEYFKKPWIKQFFINIKEVNFWKSNQKTTDNCLKYMSRQIKIVKNNPGNINFVSIYNYIDHLEEPLELFTKKLQNISYFCIICEDIKLSKKIDCQHFSSWNKRSIEYLANKIGYSVINNPLRLGSSIFRLYLLKKINYISN
jgi:hypothetical protein